MASARASWRMAQPAAVVASTGMAARENEPNRAQVTGTRAGKMPGDRKRAGRSTFTALASELPSNDSTAPASGPSKPGSLPPCSPAGAGLRFGTPAIVVEDGAPILGAAELGRAGHGFAAKPTPSVSRQLLATVLRRTSIRGLGSAWNLPLSRRPTALAARRPARRMASSRSCASQSGEISPSAPLKKPVTGARSFRAWRRRCRRGRRSRGRRRG